MHLHADDGTELQIKEGVVLDKQEKVVLYSTDSHSHARSHIHTFEDLFSNASGTSGKTDKKKSSIRVFRLSLWTLPLIVGGIILTMAVGTVVFGILMAILFVIFSIRSLFSFLRIRS